MNSKNSNTGGGLRELINRDIDPFLVSNADFILATLIPGAWFMTRWVFWGLMVVFNPFLPEFAYWISAGITSGFLVAFLVYYGYWYLSGGAKAIVSMVDGGTSTGTPDFENTAKNGYKVVRHQYFLKSIVIIFALNFMDWMQLIRMSSLAAASHVMSFGESPTIVSVALDGLDVSFVKEFASNYISRINGVVYVFITIYLAGAVANIAHLSLPSHLRGMVTSLFSQKNN